MDIRQLREQIDAVDRELLALFVKRMEISEQIADRKKAENLPVFDAAREREKLRTVAAAVEPELESSAKVLYSLLFELSRSAQSAKNATQTPLFARITDAIAQTPQLFPRQATVACVEPIGERLGGALERTLGSPIVLSFSASDAVFSAVAQGMCRYGILPADDVSLYEKLRSHGFYIVRALRIATCDGKYERFLLFGTTLEIFPGADRTSLMLALPNRPGSLYRVLARLYTLGLNISRLDCRPEANDNYKMLFFFDLETSVYAREFAHLMCELDDLCEDFQYLGSYTEVI